jgi:hypothetical protein
LLNSGVSLRVALVTVMRSAVLAAARRRKLVTSDVETLDARLFDPALERADEALVQVDPAARARSHELVSAPTLWANAPVEMLGQLYEHLLSYDIDTMSGFRLIATRSRKRSGSYYTPTALAQHVVETALAGLCDRDAAEIEALRVCDPALGAGAFLLAACDQLSRNLAARTGLDGRVTRARIVKRCLYGVDVSPLAVAVAEASLWLLVGDPELAPRQVAAGLRVGDALLDASAPLMSGRLAAFDFAESFADVFAHGGFDAIIGNPPWIAYAGRAAQPLDPERKAYYQRRYRAFRGYPTLHGLFIERAAELAPRGVLALLVPSPIADLDGYRHVRQALGRTHRVREPMLEFGQDAFASVTQPCFALVADPGPLLGSPDRVWQLVERQRALVDAQTVRPPAVLERLRDRPPLPRELFGEMGFQTSSFATRNLLRRAEAPDQNHRYPLLEGKDVNEFRQRPPRLFLNDAPELLREAKVRLRPEGDYQRARFVVRQTASVPIAALHGGLPFRNTLLAGFAHDELTAELVVGLLNSALYRALHLGSQRDARQATFPQLKIAHLRALPAPPASAERRALIAELTRSATRDGLTAELRRRLDDAVFDLFEVPSNERREVRSFLAERVTRFGYEP